MVVLGYILMLVFLLMTTNVSSDDSSFSCRCCSKRSCKELLEEGYAANGVYCINPDEKGSFLVYCDMKTDGGGWTMIQRRIDGTVDFFREWDWYKFGFGDINGEHWLGLDKIHRLTSQSQYQLRVDLMDADGNSKFAKYSFFDVESEKMKYKLILGKYSGNSGDSLSYHKGQPFTTKDRDNDAKTTNCAVEYKGGWWYKECHYSNLNGLYLKPGTSDPKSASWHHWTTGGHYSMKRAEMKIKA